MRKRTRVTVSLAAACTLLGGIALSAAMSAAPALADYAPNANDVVGGGSDTLQYMVDFAADGDVAADPGYNDAGNLYKLVSMDATADSNARFSWAVGASLSNPTAGALNPTAVYRGGTYPQVRINGSGAGINALLADTSAADPTINFARMSSNPTAAEGATAQSNGWQGLQDFVLGTENLRAAADLTNNIPCVSGTCPSGTVPGLSAVELADIYEANTPNCVTWSQLYTLAGKSIPSGVSTDTIIPILPQPGSGTRSTFLTDLGAAAGLPSGTQLTPGSCTTIGEENDPTAITSLSSTTTNPIVGGTCTPNCAADAIEPFSGARLDLYSGVSGNTTYGASVGQANAYFRNPADAYPNTSADVLTPGIEQLTGSPVDGAATYTDTRNLNIVYRWTDQISTTSWQPGSTLNWAETLFCDPGGPTPFFQTAEGKLLIAEAGGNPATQSCLTSPLT
ncbi:MAG TPA: substrate-binding domain-containing protein [Streptosporangiaceae bacterium]|nr:substrate-binding domain-containing protein [Streptosporangiaceae bacterium]